VAKNIRTVGGPPPPTVQEHAFRLENAGTPGLKYDWQAGTSSVEGTGPRLKNEVLSISGGREQEAFC